MRVDRIEKRPRTKRVDVYVSGEVALTLAVETVQEAGLRAGDPLTDADVHRLRLEDDRRRALNAGLRAVARRPRSVSELRDTLRRKGFGKAVVERTIDRLRELGYLDDRAFAEYWTETRQGAAPRARRMLRWELATKGIDSSVATEVTDPLDDDQAAYEAASRRVRYLRQVEEAEFRQKLAGFLQRRGFGWDAIRRAVDRCWAEREARPANIVLTE